MRILADRRWEGQHGIGRFASEVITRLQGTDVVLEETSTLPLLHPLEPLWLSWSILRRKPDVYFSPGFNPPLRSAVPFVFVIHDLIHLRFAGAYGRRQRAYYELVVKPALRRARAVLTVSHFSKGEILNWARIPEWKVKVVGAGVGDSFNPGVKPSPLPFPYMLYVGNCKFHKNLPRLLEAFRRAELGPEVRLVLSGQIGRVTADLAVSLGLSERVVLSGPVAEVDLPKLYRGAIALVMPSLLEGFGLPLLEAMACGTPVVASDSSSIPEVVGGAGLLFDPYDVEDMALAIRRVASDEEMRAKMSSKGLQRASLFSWDETARHVLGSLREAANTTNRR